MKNWVVRWTTDGFTIKEYFNTKSEAKKYCDKIILELGRFLYEIDMWEVK